MEILLGFAPFIVFCLTTTLSTSLGLWLAFAAAFVVTIRDFVESPSLRPLDAANLTLFGVLALVVGFLFPNTSLAALRLCVEAPLVVLALASLARGRPLTLAYRPDVPESLWRTPAVYRANFTITAMWTFAVLLMAMADASVLTDAGLSLQGDLALGLAALGLAIVYTLRHPLPLKEARQRARGPQ